MIEYAGVRIACVLATFLSCIFLVGFGSHTPECDDCLLAVPRRLGRMVSVPPTTVAAQPTDPPCGDREAGSRPAHRRPEVFMEHR